MCLYICCIKYEKVISFNKIVLSRFFYMSNIEQDSFYKYLVSNGYYFDKEIIENFLLSLKIKPFEILTGNSGIGKTKLAQLFAQFLSNKKHDSNSVISTKVKVGKSDQSGGWSITRKELIDLIPILELEEDKLEIIVDGVHSNNAKFNLNTRIFYGSDDVRKHLTKLRKENPNQKVDLQIKINKTHTSEYQIVPVGANWTDNTNIVGYYNVISEDYQSTPAYELIKEAQDNPNIPYFLILDEMNLSHVERYFADFLSAIESGEEIPLYGNNETLKLPENLFIIGTVNVDETTYMFSPKVLDRANTIEFDTLTAWEYMSSNLNEDDFNGNINYLQSPLEDSNISNLNIKDLREILSDISYNGENLWDVLAMELTLFQEALKDSNFDFGFRVINEILRFMVVSWRYENEPEEWNNWERYFDAQIKQKILPKLHGSEKAIGNVLKDLFNLCLDDRNNNETPKNFNINDNNSRYLTSALKLQNMSKVLSDQRYVSFIN